MLSKPLDVRHGNTNNYQNPYLKTIKSTFHHYINDCKLFALRTHACTKKERKMRSHCKTPFDLYSSLMYNGGFVDCLRLHLAIVHHNIKQYDYIAESVSIGILRHNKK